MRTRAFKWLSDDRKSGPYSPEQETWARDVWVPDAVRAGWRFWALVQPESVVAQMNMRRFSEVFASFGVVVRAFPEEASAVAWLRLQR